MACGLWDKAGGRTGICVSVVPKRGKMGDKWSSGHGRSMKHRVP